MHRFFQSRQNLKNGHIIIQNDDFSHIVHSLRLTFGDQIEIVIDQVIYLCEIVSIANHEIHTKILLVTEDSSESPLHIHLYQALCKGDKMDLIIQKAVELGAISITPIETIRSIVKIDDNKANKRLLRWRKIAQGAAKQSKRTMVPTVTDIISLSNLTNNWKRGGIILVAYEEERRIGLKRLLADDPKGDVHLFIGPEGGWEKTEIDVIKSIGGKTISLGPRILRTETAGLAIMAMLQYALGDMG